MRPVGMSIGNRMELLGYLVLNAHQWRRHRRREAQFRENRHGLRVGLHEFYVIRRTGLAQ